MKKVRAKFSCEGARDGELLLRAVVCGSEENEKFSEFTPFGELRMTIDKGDALSFFEPGQEYYLDITKAGD